MLSCRIPRVRVGNVKRGVLEIGSSFLVVAALEGKEQNLRSRAQAVDEVAHALDIGAVDAAGLVVRAARVEEKQPPRVLPGAEEALHARVDENAAARIAAAHQVRVRVPHVSRVEPVPGGAHQLVVGKPRRQGGAAGIPEPLLRPVTPRRERKSTGEGPGGPQ